MVDIFSKTVKCVVCGKVKQATERGQKTCSITCRGVLRTQTARETAVVGICPGCGQYLPLPHRCREQLVCSAVCYYRIYPRTPRSGKSSVRELPRSPAEALPTEVECVQCGAKYIPSRRNHRFCSRRCNNNWQHQSGQSGVNQRAKMAAKIEERDSKITSCVLCGTENSHIKSPQDLGLTWRSAKSRFHQDHIVPYVSGGTHDADNIRIVCWFCNLARHNLDVKYDAAIVAAGAAFWQNVPREPATLYEEISLST